MGTKYVVNESTGVITTAGGISLPTTGGTPSSLDYYEEATHSMRLESDTFGVGVYLTLPMRIVRIGKLVSITWDTDSQSMASGTGNDNLTTLAGDEIPARFRPVTYPARAAIRVHNNGANLAGTMRLNTAGDVVIGLGDFPTNQFVFNAGSQNLVYGMNITYIIT